MISLDSRILLVDDEPLLLTLMSTYLSKSGYNVESVASSAAALERFEESDGFQVLVTDLTLPGVTGDQLGIQLAERNQHLRVLLCSGYPYDLEAIPTPLRTRFAVLQKPFIPKMLTDSVEELMRREI